jgi:hypothetical protein
VELAGLMEQISHVSAYVIFIISTAVNADGPILYVRYLPSSVIVGYVTQQ